MARSLYVTVRDKKRDIKRQITRSAYQSMTGRYELLDDSEFVQPQKKSDPVAAPVVSDPPAGEVTTVNPPKKRGPKPKLKPTE